MAGRATHVAHGDAESSRLTGDDMDRREFWYAAVSGVALAVPGAGTPFGQLPRPDRRPERPPYQVPDNVAVRNDLVYTKIGEREVTADLYWPTNGSGPFPAIVYIHGSGMPNKGRGGSKAAWRRQAALLAAKGFVGLSISYRFRTEVHYPGCVYDGKAAVRWLRANAKEYRIDPERIGVVGTSFGGYVASMVATTAHRPELEGDGSNRGFSSRVQAAVGFAPLVDPIGHHRHNPAPGKFPDFVGARYEDNPELWAKASPLENAGKHCPPFLFFWGTKDHTPASVAVPKMIQKLQAAGVHTEFVIAEGGNHEFYDESPWFERTLQRMEGEIARNSVESWRLTVS